MRLRYHFAYSPIVRESYSLYVRYYLDKFILLLWSLEIYETHCQLLLNCHPFNSNCIYFILLLLSLLIVNTIASFLLLLFYSLFIFCINIYCFYKVSVRILVHWKLACSLKQFRAQLLKVFCMETPNSNIISVQYLIKKTHSITLIFFLLTP